MSLKKRGGGGKKRKILYFKTSPNILALSAMPMTDIATLRTASGELGLRLGETAVIYSLTRNKVYLNSVRLPSSQICMKCCPPQGSEQRFAGTGACLICLYMFHLGSLYLVSRRVRIWLNVKMP